MVIITHYNYIISRLRLVRSSTGIKYIITKTIWKVTDLSRREKRSRYFYLRESTKLAE